MSCWDSNNSQKMVRPGLLVWGTFIITNQKNQSWKQELLIIPAKDTIMNQSVL